MENMDISRDLIKKAAIGDARAFGEIYTVSSRFVFNVALRMVNNRHNAEDITQEVFIKIYKNLWKFRFQSRLSTWIYRITINTAMNYMRTYPKAIVPFDRLEHSIESDTGDDAFIRSEQKRFIEKLLSELTPQQRAVVILREFQGLDYREISRVLQININTVRSRLKRARETLIERGREVVRNEL